MVFHGCGSSGTIFRAYDREGLLNRMFRRKERAKDVPNPHNRLLAKKRGHSIKGMVSFTHRVQMRRPGSERVPAKKLNGSIEVGKGMALSKWLMEIPKDVTMQ